MIGVPPAAVCALATFYLFLLKQKVRLGRFQLIKVQKTYSRLVQ
jgi:hypothetical protein